MLSDVAKAASQAGLSPLVTRIALLLADIDGEARALEFIESCRSEDEVRALHRLERVRAQGTVEPIRHTVSEALRASPPA